MLKASFKNIQALKRNQKSILFVSNSGISSLHEEVAAYRNHPKELKPSNPIQSYIEKYRRIGHIYSDLDPLGLVQRKEPPRLEEFDLKNDDGVQGKLDTDSYISKLKFNSAHDLEKYLKRTYAGKIGVEFEHIVSFEEREWLYNRFEELSTHKLNEAQKKNILGLVTDCETIDHFLHKKFQTFKRYSGEGVESLLVCLNTMFAKATASGIENIVIGMPHRGRLNTLVRLLGYPARDLFYKITGKNDLPEELYTSIDDVVSHIAVSNKNAYRTGDENDANTDLTVSLLHNPSHLEAVNPVAMGKTKAKQDEDDNINKAACVLIHGDSAFAGQGIVYETFAISGTPDSNTGGVLHIICNNQIGYTTTARQSRSCMHSSDLAKINSIPIVHVNADSPEDVFRVAQLSVEYRQKFHKDFMIDLIGYRRHGHNEVDEPEFTNPLMYKQIRHHQPSVAKKYAEQLLHEKIITEYDVEDIKKNYNDYLEAEFDQKGKVKRTLDSVRDSSSRGAKAFTGKWRRMTFSQFGKDEKTGISNESIRNYLNASINIPNSFNVHPRILKYHIQHRQSLIEKNSLDWAAAEAVALASLIDEGNGVRFVGQDVERGTFSHRHLVLTDSKTGQKYSPLENSTEYYAPKGYFTLANSALSENGVMGFEFGYSLESPNNLVLWEAQFGDFFNPAQVVIDTFFSCSEAKWLRQSAMVLLLPHGMDGTGPEHSSCRIERFLQMGATDGGNSLLSYRSHDPNRKRQALDDPYFYENHQDVNFQFAQPTTPANYFHILRRQMMRNYRKPLVLATPKILLKHPLARSKMEDLQNDTEFKPFFVTLAEGKSLKDVENVFLCTGKISYDIKAQLKADPELEKKSAVIAIEELLPFPEERLKNELSQLNKSAKLIWMQEEIMNNGAYFYVQPRLTRIARSLKLDNQELICHARRSIASTATGNVEQHGIEAKSLMQCLSKYK